MIALQAKGITKKFPGVVALDNVDLTVNSGEIHCVVGENGAGKSTLVKVLTGLYRADQGALSIEGKEMDLRESRSFKAVAYVPQELNLFDHMTVAENLFVPFDKAGVDSAIFSRRGCERQALAYLEKLQMKARPGDLVKDISVAEQQLLQVARALSNDTFRVLILDEPTASLTKLEIDRLFGVIDILKSEGKAVIFITHKLEEVFRLNDAVTVLRNGMLVGNSKVNAITVDWIIKKMTGKEIDLDQVYRPTRPSGNMLLDVRNLSGEGFENISFSLREGEILGFAGLVGAGRSEIMQTIFGYLPEKSGEVRYLGERWKFRDPRYSIGKGLIYLSEERKTHGILPHLSVRENICAMLFKKVSKAGVVNGTLENRVTRKVMEDYNVKAASSEVEIMYLSGGNQQKVLIGRTMEASPRVLFLDEPTRGIDVKTKDEIYMLMKRIAEEERVGIVLISSELEELLKCANRVITVYNGRLHREMPECDLTMENVLSCVIGMAANRDERKSSLGGEATLTTSRIRTIREAVSNRKIGQLAGVIGAFLLIFIASCFISPNFLTGYNLTIMGRDLAFIGMVAIAQGLLLLLGDIDVSIGAIAGLCGVVCAKLLVDYGMNPVLAMATGVGAGALLGCINGLVITTFNLNSLVVTIGTLNAFTGLNLLITRGRTIVGLPEDVTFLGAGSLFEIPVPAYFLVGVLIIALFLTMKTVFGRQLYAVGDSREAARIVGIKEQKIRVIAYAVAGTFAGLAGILMAFRLLSAQTAIGQTWVLPSIAAPVIGGIATTGGIGSIAGALIGGAIMVVIGNIIVLGGVNVYLQQVFNGVIVVLAITIDSLSRRIGKRK
jgi:inositol transport system ATP-binding protein